MLTDSPHSASRKSVRQATYDIWREFGLTTVFSNPGSTEVPLLSELPDDFEFVLGLHEGSVVGMATGYALATERPALALLHTTAGLGNATGAIATARGNKAPLVVVVGQQDRRHLVNRPFLAGDLKDLVGKYPIWVGEPAMGRDVPSMMARAWHEARLNKGPALVIVPMDDWDQIADIEPIATPKQIELPELVSRASIPIIVEHISNSTNPAMVVGADADNEASWQALITLAEKLNCPVFQEPFGSRAGFPQDHQLFAGHLPSGRNRLRSILSGHDLVLVIGASSFRQYPYEEGSFVEDGTKIIVIDDDPSVLHTSTADIGIIADIATTCSQIASSLIGKANPDPVISKLSEVAVSKRLRAAIVFQALGSRIPKDTVVIEESPSSRPELHRRILARKPMGFLTAAMGGLGFAMPAAIGVRMGTNRPVVAVVGDGSSYYSIQSLWSAAFYNVGVLFVIMNNGSYSIMDRLAEKQNYQRKVWPDLGSIDITKLAEGFGCKSYKIDNYDQLIDVFDKIIPNLHDLNSPLLLDISVESDPTFEG